MSESLDLSGVNEVKGMYGSIVSRSLGTGYCQHDVREHGINRGRKMVGAEG